MTNPLLRPLRPGRPELVLDLVLTVLASVFVVLLSIFPPMEAGMSHDGPLGDSAALRALLGLTMTVPVLWRRADPVKTAGAMAVGAVLNTVLVGDIVHCGPSLPCLFLTTYVAGRRRSRDLVLMTVGLCSVSGFVQSVSDPDLDVSMGPIVLVLCAAFAGVGWLVAARQADLATLREQNRELRRQRERNAELAVDDDRERIATGLDGVLRERLDQMADAAARGRTGDPTQALQEIETLGRESLTQMREVVGQLRTPEQASGPQPVLAQLGTLLADASADSRLTVDPLPEVLPAGLELSAYRIVEHLVSAMEEEGEAAVDVHVGFTDGAVQIAVRGPALEELAERQALAGIRQRAAMHGGTVQLTRALGRTEAMVRLPASV